MRVMIEEALRNEEAGPQAEGGTCVVARQGSSSSQLLPNTGQVGSSIRKVKGIAHICCLAAGMDSGFEHGLVYLTAKIVQSSVCMWSVTAAVE